MANNPYVNKVVYGSSTLIDISDTTATASDVASGKYFYTAAGQKVQGTASSGSIIVSDTTDSHGGTIKTITTGQTLNLQSKSVTPTSSQQTVTPDAGYNGLSEVIVGAVSGGYISQDANGHIVLPPSGDVPTLISKTVTQNGTYNASSDNASGYSSVTVNVGGGNIDTITINNTNASARSLTFTNLKGMPKAFFLRLACDTEMDSSSVYYIAHIRYNGTTTQGANYRVSNGQYYNDTTHYSFVYSNGTLTISTTSTISTQGGSFYAEYQGYGTYELTYVY